MSGARLHTLLPELTSRQPVMVVGAAVIDVIADAYALPWRGCDIELKQQSVNVGGCALNIAVYSAAIFLIPICISFDTAEKRRYATYLILNRRFSFEF